MIRRVAILIFFGATIFGANPEAPKTILEQGADHWAFQPVRKPAVKKGAAIDFLVAERLRREGLSLSPEAPRAILIRRLFLDVVGFPPEPAEVAAFVKDRDPRAYEKLVDRLLASPHYGERWARHWLDVVRFAESNGFETNTPRKNAWPYRDWVIRALNEDLPYDRFVLDQLAGDAFGATAATGFLVGGPWDEVKSPDVNLTAQQRMDELHDMVATTGATFLGLTIGCARCHNHKFDPLTQVDYYAMQAIFAGVRHGERPLPSADEAPSKKRPMVNARLNEELFAPIRVKRLRFTINATNGAEPCIDELEVFDAQNENVALASRGAKPSASGTYPNSELHRLEHINDGRVGNSRSWISNEKGKGWVQLEFPEIVTIHKILWGRDREQKYTDRLATDYRIEIADVDGAWKTVADSSDRTSFAGAMVYAGTFEQPGPTHRLQRGEPLQKREQLSPALPARFAKAAELPVDAPEQQRRLALAKWIVDPANPLTARVIANRLWQFHFGAGIVETPSDFGVNGARPSNPELLDWLASELIDHGWSMKRLHREILLSAAYRQSSNPREDGLQRDAANRLAWRYSPRRLEAEALRDSMLRVGGNLDWRMGGPGFDLFEPNENYVRVFNSKKEFGPADSRRMIYLTKHRMQVDDTFGSFDCPDAGQIAPKRTVSTTPLQALSLLNSPWALKQSGIFAERVRKEGGDPLRRAFWLALGREPDSAEKAAANKLIQSEGLPSFCRALLNANEFVYVF